MKQMNKLQGADLGLRSLLVFMLALALSNCSSTTPKSTRYKQHTDAAPAYYQQSPATEDVVPRAEPRSRYGNHSPYKVFEKKYFVLPTSLNYRAEGLASWYGSKFHGHRTSSGETYNMYEMTAAHKSLPLPSFVQVTNLDNGKELIVRVNDRGPFHSERVIDLSYAAAKKLGYIDNGVARVKIEAIDPIAWNRARLEGEAKQKIAQKQTSSGAVIVQVGAFGSFESAARLQARISNLVDHSVAIYLDKSRIPNLHKVQIGPILDLVTAQKIKAIVAANGLGTPLILSDNNS